MPSTEPRSLWASSHGEKASIPTMKREMAGFGIGKLLSAEYHIIIANGAFSVLIWIGSYAALSASQVGRVQPNNSPPKLRGELFLDLVRKGDRIVATKGSEYGNHDMEGNAVQRPKSKTDSRSSGRVGCACGRTVTTRTHHS